MKRLKKALSIADALPIERIEDDLLLLKDGEKARSRSSLREPGFRKPIKLVAIERGFAEN